MPNGELICNQCGNYFYDRLVSIILINTSNIIELINIKQSFKFICLFVLYSND